MSTCYHFVDHLADAAIKCPSRDHVAIQTICIKRDTRTSIFQHPDSRITFPSVSIGRNARLLVACGIRQTAWERMKAAVTFQIRLRDKTKDEVLLLDQSMFPAVIMEDRGWREVSVDLAEFSGRVVDLIFETSVPSGHLSYCWAAWGNPVLKGVAERKSSKPRPRMPHVFLLTADALRPDYLGCYGNREIRTPNVDALAQDGVLFQHARAQSPTTLGSYASLLTGLFPSRHKILAEWGSMPAHLPSLPLMMKFQGYETIMVASEMELAEPAAGFCRLFEKALPCIANPVQDGSITTRRLLNFLEHQEHPAFFWMQYFDSHPPATPPEPFRSMYYQGDPTSVENTFKPQRIELVRGMEVVQEILHGMPLLEKGLVDPMLMIRFRSTVEAMRGRDFLPPDLVPHLRALTDKMCRGMNPQRFVNWLDAQVRAMESGNITADLLGWIKQILPILKEIESEIILWLEDVVDARYPVSQYMGEISFLDAQLGHFLEKLKEWDLYESSTIIFTAPHGEILFEEEIAFHHHTLRESCLRIPMIIKPPAEASRSGNKFARGVAVGGIFDAVDLFPTLCDMLQLSVPAGMDGISRFSHLMNGSPIPSHGSISIGNHDLSRSCSDGAHKLSVNRTHGTDWSALNPEMRSELFDISGPGEETRLLEGSLAEVLRKSGLDGHKLFH